MHITFFDAGGRELSISSARLEGAKVNPDLSLGSPQDVVTRRLSPGHFVAYADLDLGPWRFTFEGTVADGSSVAGYFDEQVSPR